MYRVMIVDDEPLILAGISGLINWNEKNCEIVSKETNGQAALISIKNCKPNILISDIKMPVLDGIALMQECQKQDYDMAFILLTNYEEFSLVQQALRLGAIDYLIKSNLTAETLMNSLDKAIDYCRKNTDIDYTKKELEMAMINRDELTKNYFKKLLLDDEINEELIDGAETLNIVTRFPGLYLIFMYISDKQYKIDKKKMYYAENIMKEMIKRYFSESCLIQWENNSFLLVISSKEDNAHEMIQQMSGKLVSVIKDYFEMSMVLSVSQYVTDIKKLSKCLNQVILGMNYYYYDSENSTIFYSDAYERNDGRKNEFNIQFLKNDITNSISKNDCETFYSTIKQVVKLLEDCKPDKLQAINACISLYYFIHSLFEKMGKKAYDTESTYETDIFTCLNLMPSLNDIINWLADFGKKVCYVLEDSKHNHADIIIQQVREYIGQHYNEKISLSTISEQLRISSGYLSSIFSRQTGETISDYINRIKIDKAKELLASHQYLVYEIADMLGFENAYYFSRVFRKVTGITPKDYEISNKINLK